MANLTRSGFGCFADHHVATSLPSLSSLGFNSKKINFRTFDPTVSRGVGWADRTTTGRWSSTRGSSSPNLATPAAEVDALAINRRHLAVIYGVSLVIGSRREATSGGGGMRGMCGIQICGMWPRRSKTPWAIWVKWTIRYAPCDKVYLLNFILVGRGFRYNKLPSKIG
jgi:hypothetical protein